MTDLISKLLDARLVLGGTGNRRRLFNRFDELLSAIQAQTEFAEQNQTRRLVPMGGGFSLRRLQLRNWKVFGSADLSFSPFDPAHPVVLIGGNNGNGKTSILEAIMVGIYGHAGHLDTENLLKAGGDQAGVSRRAEYRLVIERAMHRPAFEAGERMISMNLQFDTRRGPLEIDRRWYVDDLGKFHDEDEEVVLRIGEDRNIVAIQGEQGGTEFYQETVADLIAPVSMMPFFLFDGEQVRRLAERDLGEQVRFGIESALGVTGLRGLVDDLRDYAKDRGRDIQADDAEAVVGAQLETIEAEHTMALERLTRIEGELVPLKERRDEIVRGMGSLGSGTFDVRHLDLERRHTDEAELRQLRDELRLLMSKALPMLMVGKRLLDATRQSLDASLTAAPHSTATEFNALLEELAKTEPRFNEALEKAFKERIASAWNSIHHHPADDGTAAVGHPYLQGHRVDRIVDGLDQVMSVGYSPFQVIRTNIEQLKLGIATRQSESETLQRTEETRARLAEELVSINASISTLEAERRLADHNVGRIETKREPVRAEWERRRTQRRSTTPLSVAVDGANAAADAVTAAISRTVPEYYNALAKKVTYTYAQLAHKGIVSEVRIAPDGAVSLLDGEGRDLRENDASAGENQIFAMSLIAAVSDLLGAPLPLVIDTPLGRLDPQHRERILTYFSGRPVQTILLSQPEEVGGRYYDLISRKVASEYHLSYVSEKGGLGSTTIAPGYFPKVAA